MTRIELKELLPLMLGSADYIEVTITQANIIRSVDHHYELCHLESASDTVNWQGQPLPNCYSTNLRLWSRQDWDLTSNVRQKLVAKSEVERAERIAMIEHRDTLVNAIITHFATLSVPREVVVKLIIGDSDTAKLEEIIKGLRANGAKI